MAKKDALRPHIIRMGRRLLTLAISLCIALIAYNFLPVTGIRAGSLSNGEWLWAILVGLIFLRVILTYAKIDLASRSAAPTIDATVPAKRSRAGEDHAKACESAFKSVITPAELDLFIDVFADPGSFVVRITESASIGSHDYELNIKRIVVPPKSFTGNLLLPVLRPEKSHLVDNFHLSMPGSQIRTLSRRESVGASLAVLATLFDTAFDGRQVKPEELRRTLRDEILNNEPTDEGTQRDRLAELREEFARDAPPSVGSLIARANLWNFVCESFTAYPILAVVPVKDGQSVAVEVSYTKRREPYRVSADQLFPVRFWYWLHIQMQIAFGLIPRTDKYRLTGVLEAQSYHFRAKVPEGLYVYDIAKSWVDEYPAVDAPQFAGLPLRPIDPEWVVSDTRGLDHVHAYGRDLDVWARNATKQGFQTTGRRALVMFELREKPPGLLFVASLMSAYLVLLVLSVGRWFDRIFENANASGSSTPWPVIIFGIPAIVSGWMVSRFTADSVKLLSISTIAVTSWAVLNATISVAVSALSMSGILTGPLKYFAGFSDIHVAWSLLLISCVGCLAITIILLGLRVRRYGRRVRRKVPPIGRQMGV